MIKTKIKNNKHGNSIYETLKKVKETGVIGKGILETTRAVEKGTAKLVVIAKNVKPKKMISHLPNLCRYRNIPFVLVNSKEKLGKTIGLEISCATCAVVNEGETKDLIEKLITPRVGMKEKLKTITYVGKEPINLLAIDRIEKQIWFQQKFAKPILAGIIKGTIRLGKRIPAKMTLPVFVAETRKKLADVKIEIVTWIKYGEIRKHSEITKKLSFESFDKLDAKMKKIYPVLQKEDWITFYGFNLSKKQN